MLVALFTLWSLWGFRIKKIFLQRLVAVILGEFKMVVTYIQQSVDAAALLLLLRKKVLKTQFDRLMAFPFPTKIINEKNHLCLHVACVSL